MSEQDRSASPVGVPGSDAAAPDRAARQSGFDASYTGTPRWEIGRPQPALKRLADEGLLHGSVLDVGCGTGEHALMAAAAGLAATGVDSSPNAIAIAERKARERGLTARFLLLDALRLAELGERFDVALDCGLFHVFDDDERVGFADALHSVLAPGARYHMLCFSEHQPGTHGPRRVSQAEIRASFTDGWRVESIEPATLDLATGPPPALGWLATITRC